MWDNQYIACFGNRRNLLGGRNPTHSTDIRTQILCSISADYLLVFLYINKAFTCRNRHGDLGSHQSHSIHIIRRHRILQYHRTIPGNLCSKSNGLRHCHAAVIFKDKIEMRTYCFPDNPYLLKLILHSAGKELIKSVISRFLRTIDKNFSGIKALILQLFILIYQYIEICTVLHYRRIATYLVSGFTTKELIYRYSQRLTFNIPAGNINRRNGTHNDGSTEINGSVQILTDIFNIKRILTNQIWSELSDRISCGA